MFSHAGTKLGNPKEFNVKLKWETPPPHPNHNWTRYMTWSPTFITSRLPTLTVTEMSLALTANRLSHNRPCGLCHPSRLSHYLHIHNSIWTPGSICLKRFLFGSSLFYLLFRHFAADECTHTKRLTGSPPLPLNHVFFVNCNSALHGVT